ncbi:redoxin domain-containing protein [Lentibacillus saliphilus]|uniref:redoxin domain-containing protein n=1 Tax=Lentibacillus saliphilus TaxID=2737028 RepID=UPI001C304FA5|nr:redoxin domain-containing protein [Lentibacillus saliphilus]
MKKAIIIVVITAMFGWAIYDFVISSDAADTADQAEQNDGGAGENDNDSAGDLKVGLDVGDLAPDFELTTLKGETVKLSDYRGKRVFLNFWATWCGPCRAEMPDMEQFHINKNVVILAVNLTESESKREDVPQFVEDFELTFPILMDEETEVAHLYKIQPIPTTYLIDSNGIIHRKAFGALNYELMVQEFEKMD